MKLNKKEVSVNGEKFTVQEITIGEILPIMPRLQGDEAQQAQLEMMQLTIFRNGAVMGESVSGLGLSTYLTLAEEVMKVNGLDKEGKD
jgi:hypothetical protein